MFWLLLTHHPFSPPEKKSNYVGMLIVFFSLLTTVLITSKQARTGATKNTFLFRNGKASHSQRECSPGVSCPPEKKPINLLKKMSLPVRLSVPPLELSCSGLSSSVCSFIVSRKEMGMWVAGGAKLWKRMRSKEQELASDMKCCVSAHSGASPSLNPGKLAYCFLYPIISHTGCSQWSKWGVLVY